MKKNLVFLATCLLASQMIKAQSGLQPEIQNYRKPGFEGVNVFEDPKNDTIPFEGVKVRVGGDFAMQFQGIDHSTANGDTMQTLGNNFNLPNANLNLDIQLDDGVRMHLRTYLSSRHHPESWVKGGHISIDKLNFIHTDFLAGVMQYTTLKIGLDEINYGDAHFRRTDNARAIYNPFTGNYIMDAFSTEAFGEVYFRKDGAIAMVALSNGKMNQSVVKNPNAPDKISFYGKLGYDSQLTSDLRIRATGSWYVNNAETTKYLYGGDRAGSRYYNVMDTKNKSAGDFSGRFNPRFKQLTAVQFNPFVKYKGLEFFGIYEIAKGGSVDGDGRFDQYGAEALYRFGKNEKLYVGSRYNLVTGKTSSTSDIQNVSRVNVGGGWFITKNILAKAEYVNQNYSGKGWTGTVYDGGNFNGIMFEAVISF